MVRGETTAVADGLAALFAGDRLALARAITAVENETPDAAAVLAAIFPRLGRARVVGVTGPPGAGKSTLVAAYVAEARQRGHRVGVIAVDPSSPFSGGAILGDRLRMARHANDPDVFIRSLASRGHLGGLSRTTSRVVDVMDAAGKDLIVVETVGAGQSEVEIAELADVTLVVVAPNLGDEIQALKAGILEIADIIVVNKADLPTAAGSYHALASRVPRDGGGPQVLRTVATTGEGVAALADAVTAAAAAAGRRTQGPAARVRRLLAGIAAARVKSQFETMDDARVDAICAAVLKGELDFESAASRLIALVGGAGR